MSVSEARAILPAILDQVASGDEITITRHGRPVAVLVRPDALRARRADVALAAAQQVQQALDAARRSALPRRGLSRRRAEELVAQVRAQRRAR